MGLASLLQRKFDGAVSVLGATGTSDPRSGWQNRLVQRWQLLDARIFSSAPESPGQRAFQEMTTETHAESVSVEPVRMEQLVDTLRTRCPDLIIWLVPGEPPVQLRTSKDLRVWWLANNGAAFPGFWELVERVPIVRGELLESGHGSGERGVIGRVFAKTDHWSVSRTVCRLRALEESLLVARVGEFSRLGRIDSKPAPADDRLPSKFESPSAPRLCLGLVRLYGRYLRSLVTRRFHKKQWQLILGPEGVTARELPELPRLAPTRDDFWADPFPIRRNGETVVFFEEWSGAAAKGHIAAAEIRPDGSLGNPVSVVDREYHLSYPFLFEYQGQLFMIPESADANRIEAYRCVGFPYQWEPYSVLMENLRAFDATVFEYGGEWWMFAAIQHNGNTVCDELHLFHASGPFAEWTAHEANPVSLDIRCARPAGAMFMHDGEVFRPAQDCSEEYGYALAVQRVLHLDERRYEEETAWRIVPDWAPELHGLHTFNRAPGLTVCDVLVRRRR